MLQRTVQLTSLLIQWSFSAALLGIGRCVPEFRKALDSGHKHASCKTLLGELRQDSLQMCVRGTSWVGR